MNQCERLIQFQASNTGAKWLGRETEDASDGPYVLWGGLDHVSWSVSCHWVGCGPKVVQTSTSDTLPPLWDLIECGQCCFVVFLPAEVTYWALQKSVNATFHDLNNTKKSVPNMYWNELWQKMHDLVMWSIDSCQLSSTPHSKTIRQHMPPSVRHINSALISECICLWPNIYTLLSNQSSQNHLANQCGIINVCVAP